MTAPRYARVRAFAKLNLDLRVLGPRPDGYHELRTIFQTISLADTLDLSFTPARQTSITLADPLGIPDNLVTRAARLTLDALRSTGRLEMRLTKRIPMGAGLGGGSSDAAAVLLALPVLAGRALPFAALCRIATELGSDVPFFLLGGRAAGIGRGSELFPLPESKPFPGLLVAPGIHISTAEAYRALAPGLTTELSQNKIVSFQAQAWECEGWEAAVNDFETAVFNRHGGLASLRRRLVKLGAVHARMSGSGSAIFALFPTPAARSRAAAALRKEQVFAIAFVTRARYRSLWWRALAAHSTGKAWPPRSRYLP